jgi:sarcosine oxidase
VTTRAGKAGVWDAEVIVLGTGAWGSMATWRLAAAGVDVLAIDRHPAPHAHGSSHGLTRLFRAACLEHPGLTPLALHSAELYRELERTSGEALLDQCGGITIGPEHGTSITGVLRAAEAAGLSVDVLAPDAVRERFPFHDRIGEDDLGVFDPLSGVLRIETAVDVALRTARSLGARIRSGITVREISSIPGGHRVETDRGVFRAPRVIAALGSWTREIFPELPLRLTRMPMAWFRPNTGEDVASLAATGVFIREIGIDGGYWGHGAPEGELAKVGPRGAVARGDEPSVAGLDRVFHPDDAVAAESVVSRYLPTLDARAAEGFICHSTRTPDELFVIDEWAPGLFVAAGESGHGGKHASGVGAAVAALALGDDPVVDIDFLRATRFAENTVALAT